jgi:hypothetical protein
MIGSSPTRRFRYGTLQCNIVPMISNKQVCRTIRLCYTHWLETDKNLEHVKRPHVFSANGTWELRPGMALDIHIRDGVIEYMGHVAQPLHPFP